MTRQAKKTGNTKNKTFSLPEDVIEWIKDRADESDCSQSYFLTTVVRDVIAKEEVNS